MRIISEFHDYYDVVQAQGQDQTVVWVRKPVTEEFDTVGLGRSGLYDNYGDYPFPVFTTGRYHEGPFYVRQRIIGFCGKIYPCLKLSLRRDAKEIDAHCYSIEEVDAFIDEHFKDAVKKEYYRTKGYGKWWNRKDTGKRKGYLAFFEACRQKQGDYEKYFVDNHSPVFVSTITLRKGEIVFNACLKEYEFYRVFDVYTAFQEIAMYYGGVLGGVREHIPDVSDKDMVTAKGFDKWSFRKEPTKKKS